VSNYARKARGMMLNLEVDKNIANAADQVAMVLASDNPDQREALRLMTEVCDYVRYNHMLCSLHEELEPGFKSEGCFACLGSLEPNSGTIKLKTIA
jgi:predicted transcriptional regulator